MAIRMEKDPDQPRRNNDGNQQKPGAGGGAGMLIKFLPLILMFIIKRPKLILPILLIGGVWYFFLGGSQMLSGGMAADDGNDSASNYSLGANLDQARYDKAEVFEPLAYGSWNSLPERVSLEQYAPRSAYQGTQGSCVGWASAYAAQTILHAKATGQDPNKMAFSPAYLYNQIALRGCEGAYMLDAMRTMQQNGAVPLPTFPYDERSCTKAPASKLVSQGQQFRLKGYNRLTLGHDKYSPDIEAIKQNLAQGAPVVIGMQVGGTFMNRMVGQKVWRPAQSDYAMRGFSGHAMCVIGYSDKYEGGSFQIMNSWGEQWGDKGIAWVRYGDFQKFVKEAYGLYPMGSTQKFDDSKMAVEFGLLDLATEQTIPLAKSGESTFRSVKPIKKGDRFKVLVANTIECYTYVFGQEANGTSTVLFPYTEKHSAYCGITGTRIFPRDYSMVADEVGSTDYIAVVVSKKEIDFKQLNGRINSSRQKAYADKLKEALANERIERVTFKDGKTVAFSADTKGKNAVGIVIALDKR